MTVIAITICAAVCGWSILLVISDERQRALVNAQASALNAQPAKADKAKVSKAKPSESEKRKN